MGCLAEEGIPKDARDARVAGVEAPTDSPLGVVRQVLGVVAPPGAVVVPKMMERVLGDSDRQGGFVTHVGVSFLGWRLKHQEPG